MGDRAASRTSRPDPTSRRASLSWSSWRARRDLWPPLASWVVARVIVAAGFAVAVIGADELVDQRPLPLQQRFLAWDGAWYGDIADHGYDGVAEEGLRFFPLVPLLARALAVPLLGNVEASLAVVANASALAAAFLLYRLVLEERGHGVLAARVVWLVALFPAAAVLAVGYAEATALALACAVFLLLRRRRWWGAAACGFLGGLTRPMGAALALPAVIEAARGIREVSWRERAARGAAIVAPVAGLLSYLVWVRAQYGDLFLPLRIHERADLRGDYLFPLVSVARAIGDVFTGDALANGLHVPFVLGAIALLVPLFRGWPASYGWYASALIVAAISAESLGSFERYALMAFPLFFPLARLLGHPAVERTAMAALGAGLLGFTTLTFLGAFVP